MTQAPSTYPQLRLPAYGAQVRPCTDAAGGPAQQIYDPLRRKWVALTPEEWVRQHFVNYLVTHLGYSPYRIANEVALRVGTRRRRADTVVYDDHSQPLMVVEYKAASVAITQRVIDQIARYNTVYRAPYLVVTNGMRTVCMHVAYADTDGVAPTVTFLDSMPRL